MATPAARPLYRQLRFRLTLYLAAALILAMPIRTALEHHFLYFPSATHEATPADAGLAYEEVTFGATDGTVLGGWLVPGEEGAPVVLFCTGNAGNISHRLDTLRLLNRLGVATFIFNYRGYGTSAGKASEQGTYSDIAGAVNYLEGRGWAADRRVFFGRSLGAAVALQGALDSNPAGVIMEAPFTSIEAMGKHHYPLLYTLLGWVIGASYDNLGKIEGLESPLLLIHGLQDRICPPEMTQQLHDRAPGKKAILWVPAAGHNDAFMVGGERYRQTLREAIGVWTGFVGAH